jgi:hypothetical protein
MFGKILFGILDAISNATYDPDKDNSSDINDDDKYMTNREGNRVPRRSRTNTTGCDYGYDD